MSRSHLSAAPSSEKRDSLYDFGLSTNRPISAPLPTGMGLDLFQELNEWRKGGPRVLPSNLEPESSPRNINSHNANNLDDVLPPSSSSFSSANNLHDKFKFEYSQHIDAIPRRPKSAAPQLNGNIFATATSVKEKQVANVSESLFRDFDIMHIGSRRPASTGVIDETDLSSSTTFAVVRDPPMVLSSSLEKSSTNGKHAHASFMDTIKEDSPSKSSLNLEFHPVPGHPMVDDVGANATHTASATTTKLHEFHQNQTRPNVGLYDALSHDIPSDRYNTGVDGYPNHHEQNRFVQQNQMQYKSPPRSFEGSHHILSPMSHMPQTPNSSLPVYFEASGARNPYGQGQGMQFYDLRQIDGIPAPPPHHRNSYIQPTRLQNNGYSLSNAYVNPSYGGYANMEFHHPIPHHYHHSSLISPQNPNMMSHNPGAMSHSQQFIAALPVPTAISGSSAGGFIYFQPSEMSPARLQGFTVVDGSGMNSNTLAMSPMNSAARLQKKSIIRNESGDKNGRKSGRTISKKAAYPSTVDASKLNLSSGTLGLLEEYRLSKDRFWTANDVKGHIVEFCQDQNGSRFIQQRLEMSNPDEKLLIASEVLPFVEVLRNDVFGNYVVQKLFEYCDSDIKTQLKTSMIGQMLSLSSQVYGCRVVQKALEKLGDEDLVELLSEYHNHALNCIHDQNGNHVIQKIIEVVSTRSKTYQAEDKSKAITFSAELQFILDCVINNVVSLSCHPFGCRVIQRILEHCVETQKAATLDCIQGHLRTLLDDQYGNYVIQHVLQFGRKSDRDVVLEIIVENGILELSRQKFASNVIEKLLKYGNSGHRNRIVREILKVVEDKTLETGRCSVVLVMVRDAYANYVVQTTLDVVPEGPEKRLLLQELRDRKSVV